MATAAAAEATLVATSRVVALLLLVALVVVVEEGGGMTEDGERGEAGEGPAWSGGLTGAASEVAGGDL